MIKENEDILINVRDIPRNNSSIITIIDKDKRITLCETTKFLAKGMVNEAGETYINIHVDIYDASDFGIDHFIMAQNNQKKMTFQIEEKFCDEATELGSRTLLYKDLEFVFSDLSNVDINNRNSNFNGYIKKVSQKKYFYYKQNDNFLIKNIKRYINKFLNEIPKNEERYAIREQDNYVELAQRTIHLIAKSVEKIDSLKPYRTVKK